jgi:hypothetical protein
MKSYYLGVWLLIRSGDYWIQVSFIFCWLFTVIFCIMKSAGNQLSLLVSQCLNALVTTVLSLTSRIGGCLYPVEMGTPLGFPHTLGMCAFSVNTHPLKLSTFSKKLFGFYLIVGLLPSTYTISMVVMSFRLIDKSYIILCPSEEFLFI